MRPEKQLLLDEVKRQIQNAPGFVLMSYQKMDPNLTSEFRNAISEGGGFLYVVKKSIFLKAAEEAGLSIDESMISGHLGVVYSGEDTVTTTKTVYKYKKNYSEMLDVLGASFEGKICTPQEVEEISKLPSKDEMRAQFLGVLAAPMSETVGTIQSILTSVIYCVENKIQKEEG